MFLFAVTNRSQPKAGQGMNTAFHDAINLAWKIHAVEGGFARRDLLKTYESERRGVAEALLQFDNQYAKLFSQRPAAAKEAEEASERAAMHAGRQNGDDAFVNMFKESCEFTSGYGVAYGPNHVNWSASHSAKSRLMQPEGVKLEPGHIFTASDVTRVSDANVVHLEQEVPMNGSFRLFVFAGAVSKTRQALQDLADGFDAKGSFYKAFERPDIDQVSHHERHNPHSRFFTVCTIFAAKRAQVEISRDVPQLLARYRHHIYADDRWDRRVPEAKAAAHAKMGIDHESGAVVVVRPDGHVGAVVSLEEGRGTTDAIGEYFSAFTSKKIANRVT